MCHQQLDDTGNDLTWLVGFTCHRYRSQSGGTWIYCPVSPCSLQLCTWLVQRFKLLLWPLWYSFPDNPLNFQSFQTRLFVALTQICSFAVFVRTSHKFSLLTAPPPDYIIPQKLLILLPLSPLLLCPLSISLCLFKCRNDRMLFHLSPLPSPNNLLSVNFISQSLTTHLAGCFIPHLKRTWHFLIYPIAWLE